MPLVRILPSARTWRRLTVWLHVLTSVGWMALAASLAALLALTTADPAARGPALLAADHLDAVLLAPLAVGSALTGIVLAAATPYGFFHHLVGRRSQRAPVRTRSSRRTAGSTSPAR